MEKVLQVDRWTDRTFVKRLYCQKYVNEFIY